MERENNKHPSREKCMALLKEYNTPEHVIRHCIAVTDTALKIAGALNEHGNNLNMDLIQAAGLLHDIARVEDKHWDVGADYLSSLGYDEEADIVRVHMFYIGEKTQEKITELDIICLSDRMVKENKFVGLQKRMQYVLDKYKGNKEATERIGKRVEDAQFFIDRIENEIGMSIFHLMRK
ncbi:HD domain-containing protein [Anaerovorax odorimutans]|uniref:HD domain-containing protein n=1 Tax=Anaerovorax odorimutans TaxID=109327 RepID=UPI0004201774|nr:HD domain-containing protein [Anaerovorax odorimutans]